MNSRLRVRYSRLLAPVSFALTLVLNCLVTGYGQTTPCPDPVPQTVGTHRFRQAGDSFSIPVIVADCQPVVLELRWSNGPNNGSNFIVTFFDDTNQPIYSKQIWGFMTGNQQFPFSTLEIQPWLGNQSMIAVPATVTIQAVQPFAYPSSISYRLTRTTSRHPQQALQGIDEKLAMNLRFASGKLLSEGPSSKSIQYRLEEIRFDRPREIELGGKKQIVENAFRITVFGEQFASADLIWIDDAALPAFSSEGQQSIAALIYDTSVLRDGAEISMSKSDGTQFKSLSDRLKLPSGLRAGTQSSAEPGNAIMGIHTAARLIGTTRQPLVQIELKTDRPFPAKEAALQLQVGKKFFSQELSGDHTGRTLTLSLTPEMFAQLKDGAEVTAFFNKPDRSGVSNEDVWYFGRLNKSILSQ